MSTKVVLEYLSCVLVVMYGGWVCIWQVTDSGVGRVRPFLVQEIICTFMVALGTA